MQRMFISVKLPRSQFIGMQLKIIECYLGEYFRGYFRFIEDKLIEFFE